MKILLIAGSCFTSDKCGVGDYAKLLFDSLSTNIDIRLISDTTLKKDNLVSIKDWKFNNIKIINKLLNDYKPDLVHIQSNCRSYKRFLLPKFLPLYFYLKGYKVLHTFHENFYRNFFKGIPYIFLLIFSNKIIVVKESFLNKTSKFYNYIFKIKKLILIENSSNIQKSTLSENERILLRQKLSGLKENLVIYFGIISQNKGVIDLFNIIDFKSTKLIIIAHLNNKNKYHQEILNKIKLMNENDVLVTGEIDSNLVANYLYSADAVVFPFLSETGNWSSSINAALMQGTFVVKTGDKYTGYNLESNTFTAKYGDCITMQKGLYEFIKNNKNSTYTNSWPNIIEKHISVYKEIIYL